MVKLAKLNHPDEQFFVEDICTFDTAQRFQFILSWDSIFHLPLSMQEPVLEKLCRLLADGGVFMYTCGDAVGEHDDQWRGETFGYSSLGIDGNLKVLAAHGVICKHLELDQWPERHVVIVGVKSSAVK